MPATLQRPRTPLVLLMSLLTAIAAARAAAAPPLTADGLFDPDVLVHVDITLPAESWEALRHESRSFVESLMETPAPSPFTYFKGDVTINGVEIKDVGIRKKGFLGSLDETRPSLKIHFSKYRPQAPVAGRDRLTLNNNNQDRTLASQPIVQRLYREAGAHASRCNHARVTVNGELLGIYANVESVKPPMLADRFGDGGGDLFEGTVADFYVGKTARFEAKTRDADRAPIERVATLLAQDPLDVGALGDAVDLDAFVRFWAVESLVSFWDGYCQDQNNFFVYRNPANDKLYFLPWGVDCAFETRMPIAPFTIKHKSVHHRALLPNRLYREPAIRRQYRAALERLLAEHWIEADLQAELSRIETLVADHLHPSQRDFHGAVENLRAFIAGRRDVIERELAQWPLALAEPNVPGYFRAVGTVTAAFTTEWGDRMPVNPFAHGTVERFALEIDGAPVEVAPVGVAAGPNPDPNAGDDDTPTVLFVGRRASDGTQVIIGASLAPADFTSRQERPVQRGFYLVGETIGPNANPVVMGCVGTLRLDEAGLEPGDPVRGTLSMRVLHYDGAAPRGDEAGDDAPGDLYPVGSTWAVARSGDVDAMRAILDDGADPETRDPTFGITALAAAVVYGHADIASLLLERGADVNGTNRDGATALHVAAFLGRVESAALLMRRGADSRLENFRGESVNDMLALDWRTVAFIASMLKCEVDRDEVFAGREAITGLLE